MWLTGVGRRNNLSDLDSCLCAVSHTTAISRASAFASTTSTNTRWQTKKLNGKGAKKDETCQRPPECSACGRTGVILASSRPRFPHSLTACGAHLLSPPFLCMHVFFDIAAAAWGQKLSKHNVGLNSRSGRLFLSLRYGSFLSFLSCGYVRTSNSRVAMAVHSSAESLHGGGGYKVEEEEVAPNSETGAPLAKHRPKRIFTEAEQEERQIRREEYAQQRASRLEKIASGETGLGKVRQHVNPLAPAFRDPIPTPDWKQVCLCASASLSCSRFRSLFNRVFPEIEQSTARCANAAHAGRVKCVCQQCTESPKRRVFLVNTPPRDLNSSLPSLSGFRFCDRPECDISLSGCRIPGGVRKIRLAKLGLETVAYVFCVRAGVRTPGPALAY